MLLLSNKLLIVWRRYFNWVIYLKLKGMSYGISVFQRKKLYTFKEGIWSYGFWFEGFNRGPRSDFYKIWINETYWDNFITFFIQKISFSPVSRGKWNSEISGYSLLNLVQLSLREASDKVLSPSYHNKAPYNWCLYLNSQLLQLPFNVRDFQIDCYTLQLFIAHFIFVMNGNA